LKGFLLRFFKIFFFFLDIVLGLFVVKLVRAVKLIFNGLKRLIYPFFLSFLSSSRECLIPFPILRFILVLIYTFIYKTFGSFSSWVIIKSVTKQQIIQFWKKVSVSLLAIVLPGKTKHILSLFIFQAAFP
jgi:hypothetical protein